VGKEDPANMGQGETTGYDYDVFDKMSDATDKLKTQFVDKDVRGGWKNFGQLSAWDVLSHNFARYFFPDCTVVR
jgi:hypothetical protein